MSTRALASLALALALISLPGCLGVQRVNDSLVGFDQSQWTLLGQRRVRLAGDHDVIPVTALRGSYSRIMIVVHDSALEMYDVKVTFANGDTFSPATRLIFAEDSRSRVIDLPGRKRLIRQVDFSYRSRNALTGRAEVELWGRR